MSQAISRFRVLVRDTSGVVFLEFLIVIVPLWTFSLCVFQFGLIAQANLIVRHSADAAARSAAVVLPDDPSEYGGEPEMSVGRNRVTSDDVFEAFGSLSDLGRAGPRAGVANTVSQQIVGHFGRSRLNTIRLAAHVPLMPLAPHNIGRDSTPTLKKALGSKRSLLSSTYYQPFAVAVTFPNEAEEVVRGPEITVRVSYAYQCKVPIARSVLCASFDELGGQEDLGQAFLGMAQALIGGRFRLLQHEATLMIHDAPYQYHPRSS